MTASDPRVGEIQARLARREAMIEDGSYKISRTRCNDPEREGFHHSHPQQVWTETLHHDSYISHLEALADSVAYLLAELRDRDEKLTKVEALHKPERRWMPYEGADISFDTQLEAALYANGDDQPGAGVTFFEVCAHCKHIEDSPCEGECTREAGYRESLWPCPTMAAVAAANGGDV